MKIRHLRHATFYLQYNNLRLLVDPMLSRQGVLEPVKPVKPQYEKRNPLVELPISAYELKALVESVDAVLLTHTHFDHFDPAAAELIPKDKPVLCQPWDVAKLEGMGFKAVTPIDRELVWRGISISRTSGKHGRGLTGKAMGHVSGYVLRSGQEPALYIAGDTIWCAFVEKALKQHKPDVALLYAGAAQFAAGGPITMKAEHVLKVAQAAPEAKIAVVHMEAINHCLLTRAKLCEFAEKNCFADRLYVPADGENIEFKKDQPE